MGQSLYYSILTKVRATIRALNLEGIPSANVDILKVYDEKECEYPGVPGVAILPSQPESISPTAGTNERDHIGYHVGVVMLADDFPKALLDTDQTRDTDTTDARVIEDDVTYRRLDISSECATHHREYNQRLFWREQIRRAFHHKRLAGIPEVWDCVTLPQQVIVPRPWIVRGLYQSSLVFRFMTCEGRVLV